ncbi:universal stress protein [Candidatus Desantisbacteria bacterium]|nr:universal stress protein [Candidatus Desantisbacteria bacterium]
MAKKILVTTDNSSAAWDAITYAICLAKRMEMELVVLQVINDAVYAEWTGMLDNNLHEELEKNTEESLKSICTYGEEEGVRVNPIVRFGNPSNEIVEAAINDDDIMLVVMGSTGKGTVERYMMGSCTEKVAHEVSRRLPCPLVITPTKARMSQARLEL